MDKNQELYNYIKKIQTIFQNSEKNIIKLCFKNHYRVNFLMMQWQVIESLGSSIKCSFLGRLCMDFTN